MITFFLAGCDVTLEVFPLANPFNPSAECEARSRRITGAAVPGLHYQVTSAVQGLYREAVILLIKGAYCEIAGGAAQATFTLSA